MPKGYCGIDFATDNWQVSSSGGNMGLAYISPTSYALNGK
jgi:hypothetical protein